MWDYESLYKRHSFLSAGVWIMRLLIPAIRVNSTLVNSLAVVGLVPPIGRVDVEQGKRLVVAADELSPVQALELDALKALLSA